MDMDRRELMKMMSALGGTSFVAGCTGSSDEEKETPVYWPHNCGSRASLERGESFLAMSASDANDYKFELKNVSDDEESLTVKYEVTDVDTSNTETLAGEVTVDRRETTKLNGNDVGLFYAGKNEEGEYEICSGANLPDQKYRD